MWPLFDLEKQYVKNPHIKRQEVQELHQWLREQPHIPQLLEHEVLLFFHACEYQLEYCKQVIDKHYTFRSHTEDFFGNMDMESPKLMLAQNTIAITPLQNLTPEGYGILMGKLVDTEPSKYIFADGLKLIFTIQDMWLQSHDLIPGFVIIIDTSGTTFSHMASVSLMQLKKLVYYLQETIPSRLIGIHFVNATPIMEKIMNLVNIFLKKELRKFIFVHSSLDSLYKHVPRHILPQEYGGDDLPITELAENTYKNFHKHRLDIMEYNQSRRVNEKLRPKKESKGFFGIW
uniref:CRAL-TRIO domain-containing protein n=1 Tax=Stomoxys calcitrans TaxID=35570 RepID=A0A1I8PNY8_STOCA|nr:unnamed protein product [Stomoxys calcitrans]